MKSAHLILGLVALGALGAVAVLAGGGARAAGRASAVQPEPAGFRAPASRAGGVPVLAVAPPPAAFAPPPAAFAPARGITVVDMADPIGARAALGDGWGPRPAPDLDPRPFSEAHWQGLEAVPRTRALIESLGLPPDIEGVILDDVSLPGDLHGFRAGDLVTAVGGARTPNLLRFIQATDRVRDEKQVPVDIVRSNEPQRIEMVALFERLGTANGETPTMIPPGARSPHPYQGPCLGCHRIGTTGSLATDQGDPLLGPPPPIRMTRGAPHRDRGRCISCHRILP